MKFQLKHEIPGRIRIHVLSPRMSESDWDCLLGMMRRNPQILQAKVVSRTGDAVIRYTGDRGRLFRWLQRFHPDVELLPPEERVDTGRRLNDEYWERLASKVIGRLGRRLFFPVPLRTMITAVKSVRYVWEGIRTLARGKMEVPVLDATAIGVSMLRGDAATAGSVMFLLEIGEILEEWTHKKSVDDLARNMSLRVEKVWKKENGIEVLTPVKEIVFGDEIVVRMGTVISFDGTVTLGEGAVNQSSLTGESLPVSKYPGVTVYAGTVLEEGELTIRVEKVGGASKYEKIVAMIEDSEKLKSAAESRAEHLADRLVPWTFGATALTWLLTRNTTKAVSVLMVDFCCALKLAMPVSVLSAIREAGDYRITVKGGKYLEAVAEADTMVFDKTGTLTCARPTVREVVPFCDRTPDELLRIAACMEEHFPHSMAKAVVTAAAERNLVHEEMHSKVEYIVAHGIATRVNGCRTVIGSYHFVLEDEQCTIPAGYEERFRRLPGECSQLYMGIEGELAAVILVEDPLKEGAEKLAPGLKREGISKIVMMTGDSARTAEAIARKVGVDRWFAEVLPEDKAGFIEEEKKQGHKVIMIGDGVNDSPALSAADVGVAISDGAELAREIADVTIASDDLDMLIVLRKISYGLMQRIQMNYRTIVGFNSGLIALGVCGILSPAVSALLHNASTLLITMRSMKNLLPEEG